MRRCTGKPDFCYFNPRSPHGERQRSRAGGASGARFQSTLPARGATVLQPRPRHGIRDFNPRSPHGERRNALISLRVTHDISIHAPRTGSDVIDALTAQRIEAFQSTLPARGATDDGACYFVVRRRISIHAPRTGSDASAAAIYASDGRFQSTLPARGATERRKRYPTQEQEFQSTLPARGATIALSTASRGRLIFQSTLPARGATDITRHTQEIIVISIHAPRTGSDKVLM